jgi:hypothetical protein
VASNENDIHVWDLTDALEGSDVKGADKGQLIGADKASLPISGNAIFFLPNINKQPGTKPAITSNVQLQQRI